MVSYFIDLWAHILTLCPFFVSHHLPKLPQHVDHILFAPLLKKSALPSKLPRLGRKTRLQRLLKVAKVQLTQLRPNPMSLPLSTPQPPEPLRHNQGHFLKTRAKIVVCALHSDRRHIYANSNIHVITTYTHYKHPPLNNRFHLHLVLLDRTL